MEPVKDRNIDRKERRRQMGLQPCFVLTKSACYINPTFRPFIQSKSTQKPKTDSPGAVGTCTAVGSKENATTIQTPTNSVSAQDKSRAPSSNSHESLYLLPFDEDELAIPELAFRRKPRFPLPQTGRARAVHALKPVARKPVIDLTEDGTSSAPRRPVPAEQPASATGSTMRPIDDQDSSPASVFSRLPFVNCHATRARVDKALAAQEASTSTMLFTLSSGPTNTKRSFVEADLSASSHSSSSSSSSQHSSHDSLATPQRKKPRMVTPPTPARKTVSSLYSKKRCIGSASPTASHGTAASTTTIDTGYGRSANVVSPPVDDFLTCVIDGSPMRLCDDEASGLCMPFLPDPTPATRRSAMDIDDDASSMQLIKSLLLREEEQELARTAGDASSSQQNVLRENRQTVYPV